MYYHLKKIAVGIETVDRLRIRQSMIHETYGKIIHSTRNMPKKSSELIKSGSIFWIIKRYVLVRQKITDIKQVVILMVDRNAIFQEFIVRPTEFNYLTKKWKNRLIEFDKKYNV